MEEAPVYRMEELARRLAIREDLFLMESEKVVSAFFRFIRESLESGEDVNIFGFGRLHVVQGRHRRLWDFKKSKVVERRGRPSVTFRPGRPLRRICEE